MSTVKIECDQTTRESTINLKQNHPLVIYVRFRGDACQKITYPMAYQEDTTVSALKQRLLKYQHDWRYLRMPMGTDPKLLPSIQIWKLIFDNPPIKGLSSVRHVNPHDNTLLADLDCKSLHVYLKIPIEWKDKAKSRHQGHSFKENEFKKGPNLHKKVKKSHDINAFGPEISENVACCNIASRLADLEDILGILVTKINNNMWFDKSILLEQGPINQIQEKRTSILSSVKQEPYILR